MAIVKSVDGKFFDIDDAELEKYLIKPEDLPQEGRSKGAPAGARPQGQRPPTGQAGPSGQARSAGVSPVTIVINMAGDGQSGPMPNVEMRGQGGAPGPETSGDAGGDGQDVEGRWWRNCGWYNCWRNCWRNCF